MGTEECIWLQVCIELRVQAGVVVLKQLLFILGFDGNFMVWSGCFRAIHSLILMKNLSALALLGSWFQARRRCWHNVWQQGVPGLHFLAPLPTPTPGLWTICATDMRQRPLCSPPRLLKCRMRCIVPSSRPFVLLLVVVVTLMKTTLWVSN